MPQGIRIGLEFWCRQGLRRIKSRYLFSPLKRHFSPNHNTIYALTDGIDDVLI